MLAHAWENAHRYSSISPFKLGADWFQGVPTCLLQALEAPSPRASSVCSLLARTGGHPAFHAHSNHLTRWGPGMLPLTDVHC